MKTIDLPPYAPTLIESTRAIGYSLEAAIADIIDNSISANADIIEVSYFPSINPYISILDNGTGMNEEAINIAMQYGSISPLAKRSKNDLGRFGLGLKTASLSQCRSLTVISKQSEMLVGRRWDIDHVVHTGSWSLLVLDSKEIMKQPNIGELNKQKNGTLVIWQNLDRLGMGESDLISSLGRKMDEVRTHLCLVYHRFLAGEQGIKKLCISMNHELVKPADPFLVKKSTKIMDDEIIKIDGDSVVVRPYILPHISKLTKEEIETLGGKDGLRKQQGFYIYRNKRLLIWGTWFRMMRQGDLSKLARVQVDIPNSLDSLWTLDIKKSSALPPVAVKTNLEAIVEKIAEKSKTTWTYRGRKETDDAVDHVWTRLRTQSRAIMYSINRDHPLVDQIREIAPDARCALEALLKQIERHIPLNQLYVDLNNDEPIDNETEKTDKEMRQTLEQILALHSSPATRNEMLRKLSRVEPFCAYPELLDKYIVPEV